MIQFRIHALLLLCLLRISTLSADEAASSYYSEDKKIAISQHRFETISSVVKHNLKAPVRVMLQQTNGIIWFGTDKGASRYDGQSFRYFDTNTRTNALSGNNVNALIEDVTGTVWVGTDSGVNAIDVEGNVTQFSKVNGLSDTLAVNGLVLDDESTLWVSSNKGIAYLTDDGEFHLVNLDDSAIYSGSMTINVHDNIIYATHNDRLYEIIHSDGFVYSQSLRFVLHLEVAGSFKDDSGNIWYFSNDGKIVKFNTVEETLTSIQLPIELGRLSLTSLTTVDDDLYLTTLNKGVLKYNYITDKVTLFQTHSLLPSSLLVDETDSIWLGHAEGVVKYSSVKQGSYAVDVGAKISAVDYHASQLLLTTTQGLLRTIDSDLTELLPVTAQKIEPPMQINGGPEGYWLADSNELYWIANGSSPGLIHAFSQNHSVLSMVTKNNDQLWVLGDLNRGVALLDRRFGLVKQIRIADEVRSPQTHNESPQFLLDRTDNLWLTTNNGIIALNTSTEEVAHWSTNKQGEFIEFSQLTEDGLGHIWAATTSHGLLKFNKLQNDGQLIRDSESNYFNKNGIPLTNAVADGNKLWLTSANELYQYHIPTKTVTRYPSLIDDIDITFSEGTLVMQDNLLSVASDTRLIQFDTKVLHVNRHHPSLIFSQVLNDNRKLATAQNKREYLTDERNNITFHFGSVDFNSHKGIRYKYQLLGYDDGWQPITDVPKATYTNLPPDDYTFLVKGTNSDGYWSDKILRYPFSFRYPWWHYAILLSFAILGSLLLLWSISRRKRLKILNYKVNYDNLTGIPNRYCFNQTLQSVLAFNHKQVAVALIDLDEFKQINDTKGHISGDLVLQAVSSRLEQSILADEFVARVGGDEFALIIPAVRGGYQVSLRLHEIHQSLSQPYSINGETIICGASIGVDIFPLHTDDSETLLKNADFALYQSKHQGRSRLCFFNQEMNDKSKFQQEIRERVQVALQRQEFELYYQPKNCVKTHAVVGFEVLLRWVTHDKGIISPNIFIPEAESNGAIITIGEWVLVESCRRAAQWHRAGLLRNNLSVNISPVQMKRGNLKSVVRRALNLSGLPPAKLELEITESILMKDLAAMSAVIREVRELGVKIALDDFGTGYSSLSYLTSIPLDTLKIDKSFVDDIAENKTSREVLKNIFNLAADLKVSVVVEGIETEEQLAIVAGYECDIVQGFLFSPPVPVQTIERSMRDTHDLTIDLLPKPLLIVED